MSAHTPGPWTLEEGNGINHIIGENAVLAQVSVWPIKADESEANARLVAAGPDMYDYIKEQATKGDAQAQRLIAKVNA